MLMITIYNIFAIHNNSNIFKMNLTHFKRRSFYLPQLLNRKTFDRRWIGFGVTSAQMSNLLSKTIPLHKWQMVFKAT